MPKFSLYTLPLIGTTTYFLMDIIINSAILSWLYSAEIGSYLHDIFTRSLVLFPVIILTITTFFLLIPLLSYFKMNICNLKSSLAIVFAIMIGTCFINVISWVVIPPLFEMGNYSGVSLYLLTQFCVLILLVLIFWGTITLILYLLTPYLNLYKSPLPQGQKRWLIANLLSILGVFGISIWLMLPLLRSLSFGYSFASEIIDTPWIYAPTTLSLLLLAFSKKIILRKLEYKVILSIGLRLSILNFLTFIAASWINLQGKGSIGAVIIAFFASIIIGSIFLLVMSRWLTHKYLKRSALRT